MKKAAPPCSYSTVLVRWDLCLIKTLQIGIVKFLRNTSNWSSTNNGIGGWGWTSEFYFT